MRSCGSDVQKVFKKNHSFDRFSVMTLMFALYRECVQTTLMMTMIMSWANHNLQLNIPTRKYN